MQSLPGACRRVEFALRCIPSHVAGERSSQRFTIARRDLATALFNKVRGLDVCTRHD